MTKEELDALEALANASTPGPWVASGHRVRASGDPDPIISLWNGAYDAAFVAAARESTPRLIARVRELEEILDETEELLCEPPCDHCNNCDEGCWGPRRESMQDRGSRALRGRIA